MKITGTVTINTRNNYIRKLGREAAQEGMLDLAIDTQTQAKINVSPGMGPGPHPHITPHVDTGYGRTRIMVDVVETGNEIVARVFTDFPDGEFDYLAAWETGVHVGGRLLKYPWLMPALQATVPDWRIRAARKMKTILERP